MVAKWGCMGFDFAGNERFKFMQAGFDETRLSASVLHGFLSLQPVARDTENDALVARKLASLDEFLRAGDSDAAGRLSEDSSRLGEKTYSCDDLIVGDVLGVAAGFFHCADCIVAVGRRADGEGLYDGLRPGHGLDDFQALLHRLANG